MTPGRATPPWIGLIVVVFVFGMGVLRSQWLGYGDPDANNEPAATIPGGLPFRLEEISGPSGASFTHESSAVHPSLQKWARSIASVGAAVAVADVDGDGWQDIYATNNALGSRNRLFINLKNGTFREQADRFGLGDINRSVGSRRALFVDLDNDGRKDLLLTTMHGSPRVFLNRAGRFVEDFSSQLERGSAYALNVVDLDGDGYLDLLIGYARPFDFNPLAPDRYDFNNNTLQTGKLLPGRLRAYRNDGHGRFTPSPGLSMPNAAGYPHAVGVYDLSGDGRPYIHWALDYAPRDALFRVDGPGVLTDVSDNLLKRYMLSSMSSEMADLDEDGEPSVYVTQIYNVGWAMGGNMLLKFRRNGRIMDMAAQRGVRHCGFAWGAKFIDLDLDGRLDLVVANGHITGGRDYNYRRAVIAQASPGVQRDIRNWPAFGSSSLSGGERDCVFYNLGKRFVEVASQTGLTERLDGRGLAVIDPYNDGTPAFIIVNQGQPLRFYVSRLAKPGRWIGFDLRGVRSNRDSWGAKVTLTLDNGRAPSAEVQPGNGYMAQSDPRLKFGLGAARVLAADIRWPSGRRLRVDKPQEGRYHRVVEP